MDKHYGIFGDNSNLVIVLVSTMLIRINSFLIVEVRTTSKVCIEVKHFMLSLTILSQRDLIELLSSFKRRNDIGSILMDVGVTVVIDMI